MPIQNAEIAALLDQEAELLEIEGANPFRVRAYRRAARTIETLPRAVASLVERGEDLAELPGIGKDLAGKISEIVRTGRFAALEALKKELPGDLGKLAALPGLGPKRIRRLHDELKIETVDDLRDAVNSGRLRTLNGFGVKTEEALRAALERPTAQVRFKLSAVESEVEALTAYLAPALDGGRIVAAGSFRRRKDTVGDVDLLATCKTPAALSGRLLAYDNVEKTLAHGPTRTTVTLRSGLQVDLRIVPNESWGAALLYFTGSKAHNIALRRIAIERGWKLNEYGLFAGRRPVAGRSEEEVYRKLGLSFIPPELREDHGEIALAAKGLLPRLVALEDVKGDLHVHTNWSDGSASIEKMAEAARARGLSYCAITDHSRRVTVAHGLDARRLSEQGKAIDKYNAAAKTVEILRGVEVDILADGSLDLPDSALRGLDIVVAAIHSHFDLARKEQTERLIRAMDNRCVHVIAHPTGRLLGGRAPYDIDFDAVLIAAKERGVLLEINASPDRLDLDDTHTRMAIEAGVRLVVSTDAHSPAGLDWMRRGIDQARRGWAKADDIVNTSPLSGLRKRLRR
jgi:DNA polymerase (family 10)